MDNQTRKFYSNRDILNALGYPEDAPRNKVRSAESRLSNLRNGEKQRRKINSTIRDGYREKPTVLKPRLMKEVDWIELQERRRVLYTKRGFIKALRWMKPYRGNA
jgi:hypothetical protein